MTCHAIDGVAYDRPSCAEKRTLGQQQVSGELFNRADDIGKKVRDRVAESVGKKAIGNLIGPGRRIFDRSRPLSGGPTNSVKA